MINTILFDMDGTLIDTEKYYRRCWPLAAKYYGYTMTDQQALDMRSLGRPFAIERIREMFGEEADYQKIRSKRSEIMKDMMEKEGLDAKPYAKEALTILKEKGFHLVITTASDMERIQRYLKQLDLYDYFDEYISSTMVKQGKPAPDTYLYALEKLNLQPEEAIAIEDSDNGVLSSTRAGIKTICILDQAPLKKENEHLVAATLSNLLQLAQQIEMFI